MTGKDGVLLSNGLFLEYGYNEERLVQIIDNENNIFIGKVGDFGNDAIMIDEVIINENKENLGTEIWFYFDEIEDIQLVS